MYMTHHTWFAPKWLAFEKITHLGKLMTSTNEVIQHSQISFWNTVPHHIYPSPYLIGETNLRRRSWKQRQFLHDNGPTYSPISNTPQFRLTQETSLSCRIASHHHSYLRVCHIFKNRREDCRLRDHTHSHIAFICCYNLRFARPSQSTIFLNPNRLHHMLDALWNHWSRKNVKLTLISHYMLPKSDEMETQHIKCHISVLIWSLISARTSITHVKDLYAKSSHVPDLLSAKSSNFEVEIICTFQLLYSQNQQHMRWTSRTLVCMEDSPIMN